MIMRFFFDDPENMEGTACSRRVCTPPKSAAAACHSGSLLAFVVAHPAVMHILSV